MEPRVVASLDEVAGPGAEALFLEARRRRMLGGVAVGIFREGEAFLRFFGDGIGRESVFEIGSVTKTFTAELLAILAGRGVVSLEDPVAKFFGKDGGERPVRLVDLATHRSGLPRLPWGVPSLRLNPYSEYGVDQLEKYVAQHELQRPAEPKFEYSNLGFSVLGQALAKAAGTSYEKLLRREILGPLGMQATAIAEGQEQPKLVRGHLQIGVPAAHWTWQACAPCGGLCSTAEDQLKWLRWLLEDPNRLAFRPQAQIPQGQIGLAWIIPPPGAGRWHNGATAGFSSWVSVNLERRTGIVILSDRQSIALVNALGTKLAAWLRGEAVRPLAGTYGLAKALLLEPLRLVLAPLSPLLSPVAALPLPVRVPLVVGGAYGAVRLAEYLASR